MLKKFIQKNKKLIENLLLLSIVFGSLFTLLSVAMPYLALGSLKFIDGAPDQVTLGDILVRFAASIMPVAYFLVLSGAVSAFLYNVLFKENENKIFLYIWGSVMMAVFVVSIYRIMQ